MKKLYLVLFVIFITFSCSKPDPCFIDTEGSMVFCDTFYVVVYTRNNVGFDPDDYIVINGDSFIEEIGTEKQPITRYHGYWGETITVTALDPPGYVFAGWYNDPLRGYCSRVEPVVDPEDYRTAYVQGDILNMNGCNMANTANLLAAKYVRIN